MRRWTFTLTLTLGCAAPARSVDLALELPERAWRLQVPASRPRPREVVRIGSPPPAPVASEAPANEEPLPSPEPVALRSRRRAPRRLVSSPQAPLVVSERLTVVPLPTASGAASSGVAPGALDSTLSHGAQVTVPQASTGVLDQAAVQAYGDALSLVRADRCHDALIAFASFVSRWPDHPHADNAMYWRGECLLRLGETRQGIEEFNSLLRRYPSGNKVPDALLKLFLTWRRLGDEARASEAALRLLNEFPGTDAARRAHAERQMR